MSQILKYTTFFFLSLLMTPTFVSAACSSNSLTCASIGDVILNEGNGGGTTTFNFPVVLTKNGGTVNYSITHIDTDNLDFDGTQTGTLTIPGNSKNGIISIVVNADDVVETSETFNVIITAGADVDEIDGGTALGTIVNDDYTQVDYTLTAGSIVVNESVGTAYVPIRVDPAIYDDTVITVGYSTLNNSAVSGSDYTAVSGSANISLANTSVNTTILNVPINISNDTVVESQEIFHLILSNSPTITSSASHTVSTSNNTADITINDDDGGALPTLSVNDVSVFEVDTPDSNFMTFTVSLSSILTQEVVFSYATAGITATVDDDFITSSGTATIPPNTSNITIPVIIRGDDIAGEGDETLELQISTASSLVELGQDTGIGTIKDDDTGLTIALNDASIAEQDVNVTANVKILLSQALTSDLNLTYTTSDNTALSPDDYNGTNNAIAITIPSGSTEYILQFTIVGDDIQESNEYFTIDIDNIVTTEEITVAKSSGTLTIFDNDANFGCSSYIGLMTINEYQNNPNYKDDYGHPLANNAGMVPGNYVEIKYLDFLVKQHVNEEWNLAVYTTAGEHTLSWDDVDPECIDPRYEIFQMDNNVMGKEGYVVLTDQNDNEVDVLNIDNSNHYSQKCTDFIYDTDFDSSAQNKDLYREPDGTGDWVDHGNGANSGGSRCINRDGFGGLLFTKFDAIDAGVLPATPILGSASVPIKTKIASKAFFLDILSLEPTTGFLIESTINVRTYLADGITGERLPDTAQSPNEPVYVSFTDVTTVPNKAYIYNSAQKNVRVRFEYCGNDQGAYENWEECWLDDGVISQSNRRVSHSRNAFAIRPDIINLGISDPHAPNLLRAGQQYDMSVTALDFDKNTTIGYTVTDHSFSYDLGVDNTKYFKDKTEDTGDILHGTVEINTSATSYMVNGLSSTSTSGPATANTADDVIKVSYNDVGFINLQIYDPIWAAIDNDDTPSTLDTCGNDNSTLICGDQNLTFIPHHFGFEELNITNHAGPVNSEFTYIADGRGMPDNYTPPLPPLSDTRGMMAARVHTRIVAMTEDNSTTENFRTDIGMPNTYYENDINVTIDVNLPTARTALRPNAYIYGAGSDVNETKILTQKIGFGRTTGTETDDPGKRNIKWNESVHPLDFNFNREINEPANPFVVDGSFLAIEVYSHYIDPDDVTKTADINGRRFGSYIQISDPTAWADCLANPDSCERKNADNNATFYYGRARSSKYFYEDITESSTFTPNTVVIYCDPYAVICDDYNVDTAGGEIDEPNWYLSTSHRASIGDGNITLKVNTPLIAGSGSPTINTKANPNSTNITIESNGVENNVTVATGNNPTLPMTVPLVLVRDGDVLTTTPPYTNEWLIYNEFDNTLTPNPFYKVRFIGEASWTGEGQTGHVMDTEASYKKSQRVDW